MSRKTAMVIGATGVSGRAIISHLEHSDDWDIVAVSRKKPHFDTLRVLSVDLMDEASCREASVPRAT